MSTSKYFWRKYFIEIVFPTVKSFEEHHYKLSCPCWQIKMYAYLCTKKIWLQSCYEFSIIFCIKKMLQLKKKTRNPTSYTHFSQKRQLGFKRLHRNFTVLIDVFFFVPWFSEINSANLDIPMLGLKYKFNLDDSSICYRT